MTLYAITAIDKPGMIETRAASRPDHLAYYGALGDDFIFGGPFQDEEGKPTGSLLLIRTASLDAAKAIAAADPYNKAGIFASLDVRRWAWLLKPPEGI